MPRYRNALPQLEGKPFLTDGGLETALIFHEGIDLPQFASFPLLDSDKGVEVMKDYYRPYLGIASELRTGFVLESPTWRANPKWGGILGYDSKRLADINRRSIVFLEKLRAEFDDRIGDLVISGNIGPQDDGYSPSEKLTAEEAEKYHSEQIGIFAGTEADLVTAMTMTYADEAIGIVRAAKKHGIPSVVSFTVETNGALPSGQSLGDAIKKVDRETDGGSSYFMINCAHPTHFDFALNVDSILSERIRGTRVNASKMSHEELDSAEELDEGNPFELAGDHDKLFSSLPDLSVIGGCCGTNYEHVEAAGEIFVKTKSVGSNG